VRIVVGDVGEANTDITQIVEVMRDEHEKWQWLLRHLVEFTSSGFCLSVYNQCTCSPSLRLSIPPSLPSSPSLPLLILSLSFLHAAGSVLVFVTRKVNSEEVATSLRGEGYQGTQ